MTGSNPAQPHSWWGVDDLVVGRSGGLSLYYRLGQRRLIRDDGGRWRRDALGRTALEAFGALPIDAMYRRLAAGDEAWRAVGDPATREALLAADPEREPRRWREAFVELVSFVETFGPLGFHWSRAFTVDNRDADRALVDLERLRTKTTLQAIGATPADPVLGFSPRRPRQWQMVFPEPGLARPIVRQIQTYPGLEWAERIRLGDDGLPQDFLGPGSSGPLWNHQDDLRRVIGLVVALSATEPKPYEVRAAFGRLPGFGAYNATDPGIRDPVSINWRDAMRVRNQRRGWWEPFKTHAGQVDWVAAGRLALVEYLSEQLARTAIGVGLDDSGHVRSRWIVGSFLEIIYLQLLEHVEERLAFGIVDCPECGGPVLRTRLSERTRNRAHFGCAALIRKRRQRAREPRPSNPEAGP